jgi:hypothetical protein
VATRRSSTFICSKGCASESSLTESLDWRSNGFQCSGAFHLPERIAAMPNTTELIEGSDLRQLAG